MHHPLVDAGRVQVGRLLGLQQLGVQHGRRHQVAQAEARRQHLAEAAEVQHALGPVRCQRRGRRGVEPQVAIRVVFDQRHAHGLGGRQQGQAPRGRQHPAGGVLEVGQQVGEAGARRVVRQRADGLGQRPVGIASQAGVDRLVRVEGLQRAQVGGRLHRHRRAGVDHHLADQVQPLLRSGGDQHLARADLHAQRAQVLGHPLAQRREAFTGGVLQRLARGLGQHPVAGVADGLHRKGVGRRQPAGHRQDAGLLGHLEDLADDGRVEPRAAAGLVPEGHGGLLKVVKAAQARAVRSACSRRRTSCSDTCTCGANRSDEPRWLMCTSCARSAASSGPARPSGRLAPRM